MDKAVIAAADRVESDQPIDVHAVLRRLKATFGSSHRFSIDGFIGASPSCWSRSRATSCDRSRSPARPATGDPETDAKLAAELQASPKNQIEHRAAIEMVRDTLLPYCSYLDWAPEPEIVKVANVQHLGHKRRVGCRSRCQRSSSSSAPYNPRRPWAATHATRRSMIASVEGFERGLYGGAVGWVDASGNGRWAVSLRCAELSEDRRSAPGGRWRHRRRQRSKKRIGGNPSQVPSHAQRDRQALAGTDWCLAPGLYD